MEWATLLGNFEHFVDRAATRGMQLSLHPHVATMVEREEQVRRVLAGSDVPLCLDTGHLLIGGTVPVALARAHAARINHVQVKDVRLDLARDVQAGRLGYTDAVRQGIYTPLGEGDVDFAAVVAALDAVGFTGWYVLEQDT